MADWIQKDTYLTDPKGRDYTYPYEFRLANDVFNGNRYYAVVNEALVWCRDQFGYDDGVFRANGFAVKFRNKSDALAFKLRWC